MINKEVLTDMPIARTATNIASILVPAMNAGLSAYGAAGMTGPETGRLQVAGVGVGSGTSGTSQYRPDTIQAVEMVISSFGNLGEAEVGSPIVNIIPRSGGNTFGGTFYVDGANGGDGQRQHQGSGRRRRHPGAQRADPYVAAQSAASAAPSNGTGCGYFATARHQTDVAYVTNMWANKNAGNPNAWTYDPDFDRRATNDSWYGNGSVGLRGRRRSATSSPLFWDEQRKCERCDPIDTNSSTIAPEASSPATSPGRVGTGACSSSTGRRR